MSGSSLGSVVRALVSADFIAEVEDPLRDNRPTYQPSDPLLRFHYALIRRHQGEGWESVRDGVAAEGGWPLYLQRFGDLFEG